MAAPIVPGVFEAMSAGEHERVVYFRDARTGLRAIVAIHSTVLGPTLGGIRRWSYKSEAEALLDVLDLSRAMTYKAAAANLPLGGGKSVILLDDPRRPRSREEAHAMARCVETLRGDYIAAEDVGIDTQFVDWMAEVTEHVIGGTARTSGGDPSPHTADGVVHAMRACLDHHGRTGGLDGVVVAIQGLGKVGSNVAKRLVAAGARVIATDVDAERLRWAADELGIETVRPDEILTIPCDILAPCALGGVIDRERAREIRCSILCGAANNILAEPSAGVVLKDRGIVYAPDFVANAGGLIRLACVRLGLGDDAIAKRIEGIGDTLREILEESRTRRSTFEVALEIARRRIEGGSDGRSSVESLASGAPPRSIEPSNLAEPMLEAEGERGRR